MPLAAGTVPLPAGVGVGPYAELHQTFGEAFGHREARNGAHHERQIAGNEALRAPR